MPIKVKKVAESEKEIKEMLRKEKDVRRTKRLQMLLAFKEDPKMGYEKVGKRIGVSGRQVMRWWKAYEKGGIKRLLEIQSRGRKKGEGQKVPDEAIEKLREEMLKGKIRTIKDGVAFIEREYGVRYSISGMYRIFKEKLRAKKKGGRKYSKKKDPKKESEFKGNIGVLKGKFVLWADETRMGLMVIHRKVWLPEGVRADWTVQHKYEYFYLYGAVDVLSGEVVFFILPDLRGDTVKFFLERLNEEIGGREVVIVWDNAAGHKYAEKYAPENISFFHTPPYTPEVNPAEAMWKHIKGKLANKVYNSLDELEEEVIRILQRFYNDKDFVRSLTGYDWIVEALS